jgi:hypothetical protein
MRNSVVSRSAAAPDATLAPWPQYAEAVVELVIDGEHVVLTPVGVPAGLPPGSPDGPQQEAGPGSAPSPLAWLAPPVWVLTAGDPYPLQLSAAENERRNAVLRQELDELGLRHVPALGRAVDGSTWEVSIGVRGTDRTTVLAIAARHGQLAVYELDDRIRCVDVASGSVVTSVAFRLDRAPEGSDALIGPTGWRG